MTTTTAPPGAVAADGLAAVDAVLASVLAEATSLLAEPPVGDLDIDLAHELARWVGRPGKRVRPAFAWWGHVAGGAGGAGGAAAGAEDGSGVARLGAALELLHLFALVQDDVMDRSATRRGAATLHVEAAGQHREAAGVGDPIRYGDSVAVLLSDIALTEANGLVADLPRPVRQRWRQMTLELVQGQLLDLAAAASGRADLATARRIGLLKTARYTVTRPLELGALLAAAEPSVVDGLGAWGDLVGEAFALRDDVLGVWGDPVETGKPCGDDLRSRKPTRLLAWSHERLAPREQVLLEGGDLDDDAVAHLTAAMTAAGVQDLAEAEITDLMDRAGRLLAGLPIDATAVGPLTGLAVAMAWRDV